MFSQPKTVKKYKIVFMKMCLNIRKYDIPS